jgi:predicted alpha/beta-hydrolase family hydrolase
LTGGAAPELLADGPESAAVTCVLAHGAGAPMDSAFMAFFAHGLAARSIRAVRFEFPYMAERRRGAGRRPPDRTAVLLDVWRAVLASCDPARTVIGGKSLGGRMASMIADEAGVRGLLCLGYPFHPPGAPEKTRIRHLHDLRTPALILQGTRDPFGGRGEVDAYELSPAIRIHWLEDGDHSFKPRRSSGRTEAQALSEALEAAASFILGGARAEPAAAGAVVGEHR